MNRHFFVIVLGSVLLSGCGAWQSVSDTSVKVATAVFTRQVKVLNIDIKARAALNPDEHQQPLSVVVRVYQLRGRKAFDAASYADLLKRDKTVLATDALDSLAAIVSPGGAASLSQPMRDETRFVAVAVFFRDGSVDTDWRRVVARSALPADDPLKFELLGGQLIGAGDTVRAGSD